jgi:glycosyltransferase involved in cell wall biosynthesis
MLSEKNFNVIPFYSSKSGGDYPVELDFGEKCISNFIKYFYNTEARDKLASLIDNTPVIKLAHVHIYYGKLTVAILDPLIKKGIPIVQTLHEFKLSCPVYTHINKGVVCNKCVAGSSFNVIKNKCKDDSLLLSSLRFLEFNISRFLGDITKINKFICVSKFQKEKMIEAGVPENKLVTIYNFVDIGSIPAEVVDGNYLLFFGRLEKLKGVHTLISAMSKHRDKKLLIVGQGNYEGKLRSLTKELGLEKNITFIGFKAGDELWGLIRSCKAVMVPSEWYENCSMTVLEAKAYCKPVIGSSIGGITEQISDGVDGFLHAPGDIESISLAISKLYRSSYPQLALASRNDLELRYSKEVHYEQLMKVYQEFL